MNYWQTLIFFFYRPGVLLIFQVGLKNINWTIFSKNQYVLCKIHQSNIPSILEIGTIFKNRKPCWKIVAQIIVKCTSLQLLLSRLPTIIGNDCTNLKFKNPPTLFLCIVLQHIHTFSSLSFAKHLINNVHNQM